MKTIYFSHDTNSFYDPKIRILVGKYGIWSYSVFWVILEMMATQKDYKIPFSGFAEGLHPILQGQPIKYTSDAGIGGFEKENGEIIDSEEVGCFRICLAKVKNLLEDMINIHLFLLDKDNFLYSDSLIARMLIKEDISRKRMEAGHLGGITKAKNNPSNCLAHKVKESKVKESKVNKSKVNISDCDFFKNSNFVETFQSYLAMRIKIKKPATDKAQDLILERLVELSNNNVEIAIKILEQSILNSWQGVFVLRQDKQNSSGGGIWNSKL